LGLKSPDRLLHIAQHCTASFLEFATLRGRRCDCLFEGGRQIQHFDDFNVSRVTIPKPKNVRNAPTQLVE